MRLISYELQVNAAASERRGLFSPTVEHLGVPLQYYGVHNSDTLNDSIESIAFCAAIGAGVALVLY